MNDDIVVSPVLYALLYRQMAEAAYDLGYALAIHGSLTRDCDVIAVPWTDNAVSESKLVDAIARVVGHPLGCVAGPGVKKPHGRRAWGIVPVGGNEYIDLSVMPRIALPEED